MRSFGDALRNWRNPSGRADRLEYWSAIAAIILLELVLVFALIGAARLPDPVGVAVMVAFIALIMATLFPLVAVAVRRLRDAGAPPWAALAVVVPYVNFLAIIIIGILPTKRRDHVDAQMDPME